MDSTSGWRRPSGARYPGDLCEIQASLGPRLSKEARIVSPNDSTFAALEIRASSPRVKPRFTATVEVATEEDVQHTISYANWCKVPFLAVAGGHGWPTSLNNADGGIQINMRKLQQIDLNQNGVSAHVGGGVLQKQLVSTLFALGKQAVTGLCECTSIIGPLLGGGHSALQGFYGFVSDGLLSARVILADGRAVTASNKENADLYWALRGAGHNFGIVTSFEVKVYDLPKKTWTIVSMIFPQEKLEEFIDALNEVDNQGDHVPELVLAGAITRIPAIDASNPVIAYQLSYLGTRIEVDPFVSRFQQAGPTVVSYAEDVSYRDYYVATNNGANQTTCQKDMNIVGYSISLPIYDKVAIREAFGTWAELTSDPKFIISAWLLESYGSRGVWSQDYDSSAVPADERNLPILTLPVTWWAGDDAADREKAEKYGAQMRSTLASGNREYSDRCHVYLNYAVGGENLEQVYGSGGRLDRLKTLKRKYDPENRFGSYMPLA